MNPEKIDIQITCSVLLQNLKMLKSISETKNTDISIQGMINEANVSLKEMLEVDLYSSSLNEICEYFTIPESKKINCKTVLNGAGMFYLLLVVKPHAVKMYEKYIKQIDEIVRTSKKLRDQLNNAGPDFADFLDMVNCAEIKDANEPSAHKFFFEVVEKLNIIISIKRQFTDTVFAKSIGVGIKGRPKNEALLLWVSLLYNFWVLNLNRSMKRDNENIGGRKKFLEFLDKCIEPLHPELMSYNSDALDTALKQIQKTIRHGEKAPEK